MTNRPSRDTIAARKIEALQLRVAELEREVAQGREAERALAATRERYQSLMANAGDAIFIAEIDSGLIVDCNRKAEELLGRPRDELIGHHQSELHPEHEAARFFRGRFEVARDHGGTQPAVGQVLRADGTTRRVEIATSIHELDGKRYAQGIFRDVTQRQAAEDALREQHAIMEYIIRHDPNAIAVYDNDLRYIFASQRYLDDYRVADQDIIGKHHYEVFPEMPQRWKDVHQRVLAGAVESAEEDSFERADGTVDYNRWECRPWYHADGTIGGMITYTEVITARKQVEHSLRASEAKMRSTFRAAPIGIGVVLDRAFLDVNDRFCQMTGYARDELLGRSSRMLYLSDADYDYVGREKYRQISATGIGTVETRFQRKSGQIVDVILSSAPLDPADPSAGVAFTAMDITERKRFEERLRESQRQLSTLISNLPGLAYRCRNDAEWTMEFVSAGCKDVTGHAPDALIGNRLVSYADLIYESDRDDVRDAVAAAVQRREPFEVSYRIRDAAGAERWVWERGRGVFSDDGELLFLEGFIWDITARRRAEEERDKLEAQLRQAQKMEAIGQLAGGVAHDFNNILTAVFGNTELAVGELEARYPDAHDILDGLRQVEKSARRAADLTRQLLAFSRRQVIRPEVINLNDSLLELDKMLRRLITEDITVRLHCADDLHAVKADPGQIEQVIVNLVVNARDAMPDGGQLTMETRNVVLDSTYAAAHPDAHPGPHVMLAISDIGGGMDSATLERAFEPFFTTKAVGQGTGLGLSTVYGIVRQSDGHVAIYSEVGRGTTFKVYLPAVLDTAQTRAAAPSDPPAPTGTETIMICEDDAAVRELTAHVLKEAGYTVLVASRARDALQMAAGDDVRIDLLIADVIMPDMNGRRLAEALQAARPDTRTLFVSGYTANVIAHHGVLDEGVEFLEKPYTRRKLLEAVRRVLDGPLPRSAEQR